MKTLQQHFAEQWKNDKGYTSNTNWNSETKAVINWIEERRQQAQENPHWEEAWPIIDNQYQKLLAELKPPKCRLKNGRTETQYQQLLRMYGCKEGCPECKPCYFGENQQ